MAKLARADHPIHDLLQRRWSPRAFADRAVEATKLQRLFEAARWTASSYNEQPWAFVVATRDQADAYARLLGCLVEFNQSWARSAPMLMVTAAHLTFDKNGQPNRHAFYDLGAAMAQLTMQATAEGLFVHQMAGILPDKARQFLNIPEGWEAVSGVALGYLGDPATLPDKLRERELEESVRKPLADFVFAGAWKAPLYLDVGKKSP
jgi:nitroreductase